MITVKSREEAWMEANRLFPTDYMKDDKSSANAGYPIYESTAKDNRSWISDLNTSLELNIWKKDGIETIRINIVKEKIYHYEIQVKASKCSFIYECSTAYEAFQAIDDAVTTFNMKHVDMDNIMNDLMQMKNGTTISTECKWFKISYKEGEV